jgi:hypothetical protein
MAPRTLVASRGRPRANSAARDRAQAVSSTPRHSPHAGSEPRQDLSAPASDRAPGSDVADRLARLETLDLSAMRQEWRRLYRAEPPRLSRDLMMRALGYRIQEIAFGGPSKATLRRLASLAAEFESDGRIATRLNRESNRERALSENGMDEPTLWSSPKRVSSSRGNSIDR